MIIMYGAETFDAQLYPRTKTGKRGICEVEGCYGQAVMRTDDGCRCAVFQGFWRCANHHPGHDGVYIVTGQTLRNMGWDGTSPLPQVESFGAETHFVDCHYCGRNIDLYDETNDSISCDECGKIACGSYKCNYSKNPKETWEEFTCGECVTGMDAETHSHAPHDYYTPVGPSDTPDVSGYLSHDDRMDIDSFMAEGDSEWTTFIGHEQRKARNPNYDASTSFGGSQGLDYTCTCGMTCEICNKSKGLCGEDGMMYSPSENLVACSGCRSSSKSAESVGFAAEYDGPSTLSSALSGARKTDKNGRHLTIIQRLVAKYGIEKGTRIYKHFGVKQKRASPKVRGKVRGTKSGPRRYSEGRVGGAGRSQVYQKGDRTGSWTKSGGYTTSYANSGKAWYQERGYGTPVMGPVPDTALAGKAMGEKARGHYVNPAGIVGYPFVPAQQREQKRK